MSRPLGSRVLVHKLTLPFSFHYRQLMGIGLGFENV